MRNEAEIRADIEQAQKFAQNLTEDDSLKLHKESVQKVKDLQVELSASLSQGALGCIKCGNAPHGMLKCPEYGPFYNEEGEIKTQFHSAVYAVGCTVCGDGWQAFGPTPQDATAKWNKNFGKIPTV